VFQVDKLLLIYEEDTNKCNINSDLSFKVVYNHYSQKEVLTLRDMRCPIVLCIHLSLLYLMIHLLPNYISE